jgi:hypothetical protein
MIFAEIEFTDIILNTGVQKSAVLALQKIH